MSDDAILKEIEEALKSKPTEYGMRESLYSELMQMRGYARRLLDELSKKEAKLSQATKALETIKQDSFDLWSARQARTALDETKQS